MNVARVLIIGSGRMSLVLGLLAGCASGPAVAPARPTEVAAATPEVPGQEPVPGGEPLRGMAPVPGLAPMPIDDEPPPPRPAPPSVAQPEAAPPSAPEPTPVESDAPSVAASPSFSLGCPAFLGHALRRSALNRTLDAGLGTWLRGVDIEPKVDRGRFRGWLIGALYSGDPCWAEVDLRAGDVVTRINRRPIQRPEEAQTVWTALRGTKEIVVDFLRDGKPQTLRFTVVEDR